MVYAVRTQPTLPVVGFAVVEAVKQAIKGLINGVAAESERRAATVG
jgi:hypothetical protein